MAQSEGTGGAAVSGGGHGRTGPTAPGKGSVGVAAATAIGVGGMMGAGLYTLVGLAAGSAGVWLPVSFLVGGRSRSSASTRTPNSGHAIPAAAGPRSSSSAASATV